MSTIVYLSGGVTYLGFCADKPLSVWKTFPVAIILNSKYLYKGYRYINGHKDQVVVFDGKKWTTTELTRRKANGFLGIKEYRL
jgi:hypothetical protein